MEAVFLVVHLIVALAIIVVVMIQPSESGGGFVGGGNMTGMVAPRRGADLMTRVTTVLACIFFVTSLSLGVIANNKTERKSILEVAEEQGIALPVSAAESKAADAEQKKDETKTQTQKPAAPISK